VTYFIHYYAGYSLKGRSVKEENFDTAPCPVTADRMRNRKMALEKAGLFMTLRLVSDKCDKNRAGCLVLLNRTYLSI
jgi:hypothetical protein